MELTAEQKLLKAFVVNFIKKHDYEVDFTKDDWFKQVCAKPFVGNEDQDLLLACKEYLDQFREVTEKVDQSVDVNEKVEFQGCDCSMPDPITGEMPIEKFRVGSELDVCPDGCTGYGACENEYCNDWIPEEGSICWFKGEVIEYAGNIINNVTMKPFEARYIKDNGCVTEIYYDEFIKSARPIAELEGLKEGDNVFSELGEKWLIDDIDNECIAITGQGLIEIDINGVLYAVTNKQLFWRTADRAERFGRGGA